MFGPAESSVYGHDPKLLYSEEHKSTCANPWEVLEVERRASVQAIRDAFRLRCLERHPHFDYGTPSFPWADVLLAYRLLMQENTGPSVQVDIQPQDIFPQLRPMEEDANEQLRASKLLTVFIRCTEIEEETTLFGGKFANYVIVVNYCSRHHLVRRRYSEFAELNDSLSRYNMVVPVFPEANAAYKFGLASANERLEALTFYLQRLIYTMAARGFYSTELFEFLNIDVERVRREEEGRIVLALDHGTGAEARGAVDVWYLVESAWLGRWREYVGGEGEPPGPVSNHNLLDARGYPRLGLDRVTHYRCVNANVWRVYTLLYGGGPPVLREEPDLYSKRTIDRDTASLRVTKIVRGFLGRVHARKLMVHNLLQTHTAQQVIATHNQKTKHKAVQQFARQEAQRRQDALEEAAAKVLQTAIRLKWKNTGSGPGQGTFLQRRRASSRVSTVAGMTMGQQLLANLRAAEASGTLHAIGEEKVEEKAPEVEEEGLHIPDVAAEPLIATYAGSDDDDHDDEEGMGEMAVMEFDEISRLDDDYDKLIAFKKRAQSGFAVLKYGRHGRPKRKTLTIDSKTLCIEWRSSGLLKSKARTMSFMDVKSVLKGKNEGHHFSRGVHAKQCLSLVFDDYSMDLSCAGEEERDMLLWGFNAVLEEAQYRDKQSRYVDENGIVRRRAVNYEPKKYRKFAQPESHVNPVTHTDDD